LVLHMTIVYFYFCPWFIFDQYCFLNNYWCSTIIIYYFHYYFWPLFWILSVKQFNIQCHRP
jgi:hypothetical protein